MINRKTTDRFDIIKKWCEENNFFDTDEDDYYEDEDKADDNTIIDLTQDFLCPRWARFEAEWQKVKQNDENYFFPKMSKINFS